MFSKFPLLEIYKSLSDVIFELFTKLFPAIKNISFEVILFPSNEISFSEFNKIELFAITLPSVMVERFSLEFAIILFCATIFFNLINYYFIYFASNFKVIK